MVIGVVGARGDGDQIEGALPRVLAVPQREAAEWGQLIAGPNRAINRAAISSRTWR